jgi:hypothetical protein
VVDAAAVTRSLAANTARCSKIPIAWGALLLAAIAVPMSTAPLPWTDLANNLTGAEATPWREVIVRAFRPAVEYRPLLMVWIKAAYEVLGLARAGYYGLALLQYGVVLALLIWLFRPVGARRGVAAALALSCVVGLHTSRAMLAVVPVNAPSLGLILLLL